ncbi:succinate dehydrogenase assembly factor 2 [Caenimonas koreensis DSM 17982]|uniref:FAD assembly factor SdhE n=1 Tax=Caenimonas koreensis DSM 17982 TaxID=1121255 RepID=A0A844B8J0_9BURK|nr:succinate dehydrogenase assembly factor 2 [Caenimonas koreensis DSM 17982]
MTPTLVTSCTALPPEGAAAASGAAQRRPDDALVDERALSKLKWRCRRGLLENDLLVERFFARHEAALTVRQSAALGVLMDLADNDLLDLLLRRREPEGEINTSDVRQVLAMLRPEGAPGFVLKN